jgi:putative inorganic carbon (HCO3(-)) transporter
VLFGLYTAVLGFGGGLAAVGMVGTEWPSGKLYMLQSLQQELPVLVEGLVSGTRTGRIHANEMGGALTLWAPLTLAAALASLRGARPSVRWLLIPPLVVGGAGMLFVLLLTQSRSAYLGAVVGLLIILAWWLVGARHSTRARLLGGATLAATLVAGGWLAHELATEWASPTSTGLDALPSRFELWSLSIRALGEFPFTGVGMGQISRVLHVLYIPFTLGHDLPVPHAHNFFLQLGLDLGIVGAVAAVFVIGGFLHVLWTVYRWAHDPELVTWAVGLAAAMVAYLTYGLTDAIALGARGGLGLWVILGLGAALGRVALPGTASRPDPAARGD